MNPALLNPLILTTAFILLFVFAVTIAIFTFIKLKYESVNAICKSKARLDNKLIVVTGGNTGIGFETAKDLAVRGAKVIIASRNKKKSAKAVDDISRYTDNNNIEYKFLDLASFNSIKQFAKDFNKSYDRLDILINNAGCVAPNHKTTKDGIDFVMQVNYLGPFLLTNLLLDKIKASEAGRIIIVSSFLHLLAYFEIDKLNAMRTSNYILKYCKTKLCDVLWTKALAKRLPSNVTVNALHPGCIKTDLMRNLNFVARQYVHFMMDVFKFKTTKQGAQTTIHLAVAEEVAGVSGKYFQECREAKCSRAAEDNELVQKVWNESIRLTNLKNVELLLSAKSIGTTS